MRYSVATLAVGLVGWVTAGAADVGVARVDVTPSYGIRLHGYAARSSESTGVDHKVEAQALAIGSDAQKPLILVTVDSLGVPAAVVEEVAARLKTKAGVDRERFAVAASHTHSAPILKGLAPNIFGAPVPAEQQARIDQYTRELTDKLESVALEALKNRQPGTIHVGRGNTGFAANRRTPGGPVDHDVPVLWVVDAGGKPRAILTAYACHCTSIDPGVNHLDADWAGYTRDGIEAAHPGAVAMIAIGCGADSNPSPRGRVDDAKAHGRTLSTEVLRVISSGGERMEAAKLVAGLERISLPLDTLPTREELQALIKAGGAPGGNAKIHLDRLDRGEPMTSEIAYPIVSWSIDNAQQFVFLPGEVVVDYALILKREYDRKRLWVIAYANDVPGYIPSERILREGGYEGGGAMVYYGVPTKFRTGMEKLIVEAVRRLVPASFRSDPEAKRPRAKGPEEALKSMRVGERWKVELVAAEPLVVDPVAIDWGTDGSLWVCEMLDYPMGMDNKYKPGGQVKRLRDSNGDGTYDTATVFADGLPFPTGVMAWRDGILVCAAPEILYIADTDHDGKADLRKALYRGFATENYQARVNSLSYGLDNWIYGANGLIGGVIRGEASGKTVDIGGRDFRIKPDTGEMEPATGLTQQGRFRDDWGHQFGGSNSVLLQHFPMADHYAQRNPNVAAPAPAIYVPRDPDSGRLYPSSVTLDRYNEPQNANRVTSACGPGVYRDRLLGEELEGNAFICEPVHNLIHREVLSEDGITFAGHRAEDEADREFLTSTDPWFRPVQVRTGPDGAIYVVDIYRFVIEHPRWIDPEMLRTLDVRAGADKGRIYRIVPRDGKLRPIPNLDAMSTAELARAIDSPNGTLRDNVHRLLVHRNDKDAVPVLEQVSKRSPEPAARVQALAALDGLGALKSALLLAALNDPHAGVRAEAVRLAEARLDDAAVGPALASMAGDDSAKVQFQVALSLGAWDDPRAGRALGKLVVAGASDPWIVAAVHSSSTRQPAEILNEVMAAELEAEQAAGVIGPLIATAAATGNAEAMLAKLSADAEKLPAWRLLAIAELLDRSSPQARDAAPTSLRAILDASRNLARDEDRNVGDRVAAVRLLGRDRERLGEDLSELGALLDAKSPIELQRACVDALARLDDDRGTAALIHAFAEMGPELRRRSLDVLLVRKSGAVALIDACESGLIKPGEVEAVHRQRLLQHQDEPIRGRAAKFWSGGDRAGVVAQYRNASSATGDANRGAAVFSRVCAACHRLEGQGQPVGPDLAALTDRSAAAMAASIFDPNREVDARYIVYTAALTDGRTVTGMMASETGNAVTLKRQGDEQDVILRKDLEALRGTGQSLMPEGLERDLSPEDFTHLLAYLGKLGPRPKLMPGNQPAIVVGSETGTVELQAVNAEIYGDTLVFESPFSNLGYWQSGSDRAAWSFRVEKAGRYRVKVLGACADDSSGQVLGIRTGEQAIQVTVPGTGPDWSKYETFDAGELELTRGENRLEVRPVGDLTRALIDLKSVILEPLPLTP